MLFPDVSNNTSLLLTLYIIKKVYITNHSFSAKFCTLHKSETFWGLSRYNTPNLTPWPVHMSVKGKRRMDIRVFDPLHFSQIYLVVVLGAAATHLFSYFVCKTFVPTKKWHVSLTCEMSNFSAKVNNQCLSWFFF